LAFEKACIIVDLYCAMSDEERERIEEECKWVYKLIKQTDLNKMESSQIDTNADGRRATKQDIQSVTSQLLTLKKVTTSSLERVEKENGEVKASLERVEKENGEVKASLERVEKENGEMRKENGEIKSTLEEMRNEMKFTLEKLVSMLSQ
jgi:chromosome segregation ATPase